MPGFLRSAVVGVEMLITTAAEPLPGTIGVDGLKMHCAPAGSPRGQESVTPPGKDEPVGAGATVSWYAPVVCPATTVWLRVAELTEKSCITVSGKRLWTAGPPTSSALIAIV